MNYQLLINFIGFQLAWFSCVLMAAKNEPQIGIVVVGLVVIIYLYLVENRLRSLSLLFIITFIGSSWDSFLTSQQVLVFNSGIISSNMAPSWIIAMWLSFATTINVSLRWLYQRYALAFILGAIAGPLAYQAGAAFGAVSIPDNITANVMLAIGWGLLMPLFIYIAQAIEKTTENRVINYER